MQLSNIRKLELEALALAAFLHLLGLVLYGAFAIQPEIQAVDNSHMVKINLAGLEPEMAGLEPAQPIEDSSSDMDVKKGQTPAMPNSMATAEEQAMPVEVEPVGQKGGGEVGVDSESQAAKKYLFLLQNTVQQSSNMPAEATKKGHTGKAVIRLEFTRDGKVTNYSLQKSTGHKELDTAALEVAKHLKTNPFPPAPEDFYPGQKVLKFDFGIDYEPENQ